MADLTKEQVREYLREGEERDSWDVICSLGEQGRKAFANTLRALAEERRLCAAFALAADTAARENADLLAETGSMQREVMALLDHVRSRLKVPPPEGTTLRAGVDLVFRERNDAVLLLAQEKAERVRLAEERNRLSGECDAIHLLQDKTRERAEKAEATLKHIADSHCECRANASEVAALAVTATARAMDDSTFEACKEALKALRSYSLADGDSSSPRLRASAIDQLEEAIVKAGRKCP